MIGRTISHYRILSKLGAGGMGVVYEAEDINLHRRVATKFLPENLYNDEKALERFEREARAASLINHPNICAIYEIEEDDGKPFLVMELLEGENLKQRMQGKALPLEEVLDVGIQIADALSAAHTEGVVHRDIKPANIFITKRGQSRLLDFGLAKLAPELLETASTVDTSAEKNDDPLTTVNDILGTTVYMSPEQAGGKELDARSDIFSLGIVLYEMATGLRPFSGKNTLQTLDAVLNLKPVSPLKLNPSLPVRFESIIGKALEKKKEQRYQSARELRDDLQLMKRELESTRKQTTPPPRMTAVTAPARKTFSSRSESQRYVMYVGYAILALVLLTLAAFWVKHSRHVAGAPVSIAVLPFQNVGNDPGSDSLRFDLADAVAAALAQVGSLDVRPVSTSSKYAAASTDAQQAGRELQVSTVLAGHYIREGNQVRVTLQAIEVGSNRLVWQTSLTAPVQSLTSMQEKLVTEVRTGLLPRLGRNAQSK